MSYFLSLFVSLSLTLSLSLSLALFFALSLSPSPSYGESMDVFVLVGTRTLTVWRYNDFKSFKRGAGAVKNPGAKEPEPEPGKKVPAPQL